MSVEGSLACHIYCDTGQPFIMVISEDCWHWSCHYLFYTTKISRGWDSITQPSACGSNALTHCANAAVVNQLSLLLIICIYYVGIWKIMLGVYAEIVCKKVLFRALRLACSLKLCRHIELRWSDIKNEPHSGEGFNVLCK